MSVGFFDPISVLCFPYFCFVFGFGSIDHRGEDGEQFDGFKF